ncbi:hypothetical protein [Demequina sp. NBRC 110051]|uniref:hypothetical protein n=1 Tax=Demequina sp. NBRC 110051 TaxID=1570340 RepID=UPI000A058A3D|nr:hypothetical protein [Demequina sp. NBRC 110051]
MAWWVKTVIGLAAVAVLGALTVVPARAVGDAVTPVSQTAVAAQDGCGAITLEADLESSGRAPLLDLWGLTRVEVTLTDPTITTAATDTCDDDIVLTGGALVFDPNCDLPIETDEEALVDLGSGEPERRCGGDGWSLVPWADALALDDLAPGGQSFTYTGERLSLGSAFVLGDRWCAGAQYFIEQRWGGNLNVPAEEIAAGDLCIETRPATSGTS